MSDHATDVQATLEAWRRQGADRLDPVRFGYIEALARRTADQRGALRQLLDSRLAERMVAYAVDVDARTFDPNGPRVPGGSSAPARAPSVRSDALSALLDHLARQTAAHGALRDDAAAPAATPAQRTLDDVRHTVARARAQSQLRQALEQAPDNAGPLNSASLVHRALTLMHDASPEYLRAFMGYVDTLGWLEGMRMHDARAEKAAPAAAGGAKRPRGRPRNRSA